MIVDASVAVDAVTDSGERGRAARAALRAVPAADRLLAPGHFAVEVLAALKYLADRESTGFVAADIPSSLSFVEGLGISLEATPWADVQRAWRLSGSLRYTDGIYVAAAERHRMDLLTADRKIATSGAPFNCTIVTIL